MAEDQEEVELCKYCGRPLYIYDGETGGLKEAIHSVHLVHWSCYEREGGPAILDKLRSKLVELDEKLGNVKDKYFRKPS